MAKSSSDQLPAKLWTEITIPAPNVKDVLVIVAEFLSNLKYKSTYTALLAEAKSKGIEVGKKDRAGDHKSLLDLLVASHKLEQSSKVTEAKEEEDDDDSESDSDSTDSSEDDSEEEAKPVAKPEVNGATKRKREATPDSSDDESSSASSDSESDAPPPKKVKAEPVKAAPLSKTQPAKKAASEDSSSASDSSSSSDSDSDSDSESDSDSSPPPKSNKAAKVQPKAKESSTSSNGSSSSATLVEATTQTPKTKKSKTKVKVEEEAPAAAETPVTNGEIHPDRLARIPKLKEDPAEQPNGSATKFVKKTNVPFSRISPHQKVDPRFASNEYVSYDYADRAYQDLVVTKGKGFTKEKNKKKRGSYRGGMIDLTPKGIKFED